MLRGLVRPVSCHYLDWDSIIHTAIEELITVVNGDQTVRHVELPVPFRDEGTIGPPRAGSI